MFKEFRAFIARGNVVDLAVGVVMGGAFGAIVSALVKDFITPLIVAIFGKPDFSKLTFSIHGSTFGYGDFINAILSFLFIALGVFFFIVKPVNTLAARHAKGAPPDDPTTKQCPECLSDVPIKAHRCAFCTSLIAEGDATQPA